MLIEVRGLCSLRLQKEYRLLFFEVPFYGAAVGRVGREECYLTPGAAVGILQITKAGISS
jgi:hypothetical protein